MRPDTIFEYIDQSNITKTTETLVTAPYYLCCSSAERGPEDIREVVGTDFYNLYGNHISFVKHGQPLVQAAHIIDNGGRLIFKRLVAEDAALANLTVIATVTKKEVEKTNAAGKPLYIDPSTNQESETDGGGWAKATKNVASIKYGVVTVPSMKTITDVVAHVQLQYKEETDVFPLFTVTDNGRGKSTKRFNIQPDYQLSKQNSFEFYTFNVIADAETNAEYTRFSIDPNIIYLKTSMSLTESSKDLTQLDAYQYEEGSNKFIKAVSEATGVDEDTLKSIDILFGCDRAGKALDYISVDLTKSEDEAENGYDLADATGMMIMSGDNGEFGDKPFGTGAWTKEAVKFFSGEFDDSVFNPNQVNIDAVFDANYPSEVKKAILDLAEFRQDFFYFRDFGLDKYTYDQFKMAAKEFDHSKFAASYITTYDVLDPYSRKQINVTLMYSLAVKMINHFNLRRNAPCAGIQYGFTFDEAIKGTVNFCPKFTPKVDQKTELMDLGLNYCGYINNQLVLETTNTSQDPYSQLSYINNILAVQQIIHRVREVCPINRYTFITSDDLETYKKAVNNAIMQYKENFDTLEFVYVADPIMKANKIFNASIKVSFKDFVQTEIFKIYALPTQS
jgi:hypothetical protein|uniref:Tail sheath protein n=1 Tax=Myoviridae sp. ctcyQ27 TaxID=2825139 RepID=A0A8S5UF23_9CAUD|nr:MAG TPA: tail sheath protein [Myoviridae sp. ctcyQ27]